MKNASICPRLSCGSYCLSGGNWLTIIAIKDLEEFKKISDVIIANRRSNELADVDAKIYTRDIFGGDA